MIFDNEKLIRLRLQYIDEPNYKVPYIVFLDRNDDFEDERGLLEECIRKVSANKQKDWLGRLLSKDPEPFLSAWFEIMLMNWLESAGIVCVEPNILGNSPDFLLETDTQGVIIEAKALLTKRDERNYENCRSAFFSVIKEIKYPYAIEMVRDRVVAYPDTDKFVREASHWLETQPHEVYTFVDDDGNQVMFKSSFSTSLEHAALIWSGDAFWVNPDLVKPTLKEKAKSHKAIRRAGYPYIIALFIEDFKFSVEEIVIAWFGNEQYIYDTNNLKLVETKRDQGGLHLYRKEITHRSVSGTLVFKEGRIPNFRGRILRSWFIENPYANVKVDISSFLVNYKFIVVGKDNQGYRMDWQ